MAEGPACQVPEGVNGRECFSASIDWLYKPETENVSRESRNREMPLVPRCKTLPKFFPIENKRLTKNCFLIGNDLETSEVPYLTLFCIKSKERWLQMQR